MSTAPNKIERTSICQYCGKIQRVLIPETQNPARFCSKEHRLLAAEMNRSHASGTGVTAGAVELPDNYRPIERATRAPRSRKARPDQVPLCPQPYKRDYRTQNEAYDFIKQHHPNDTTIRPYRCRCGALHIGHPKPKCGKA